LTHDHDRALPARPAGREALTVLLLSAGSLLLPVVGWIAGLVLLWKSPAWTRRDRIIGSLPPFGFGLGLWTVLNPVVSTCYETVTPTGQVTGTCVNGLPPDYLEMAALGIGLQLVGIVWPVLTTIYLTVRLSARPAAASRPG
jgi:hypothetical protein